MELKNYIMIVENIFKTKVTMFIMNVKLEGEIRFYII